MKKDKHFEQFLGEVGGKETNLNYERQVGEISGGETLFSS